MYAWKHTADCHHYHYKFRFCSVSLELLHAGTCPQNRTDSWSVFKKPTCKYAPTYSILLQNKANEFLSEHFHLITCTSFCVKWQLQNKCQKTMIIQFLKTLYLWLKTGWIIPFSLPHIAYDVPIPLTCNHVILANQTNRLLMHRDASYTIRFWSCITLQTAHGKNPFCCVNGNVNIKKQ